MRRGGGSARQCGAVGWAGRRSRARAPIPIVVIKLLVNESSANRSSRQLLPTPVCAWGGGGGGGGPPPRPPPPPPLLTAVPDQQQLYEVVIVLPLAHGCCCLPLTRCSMRCDLRAPRVAPSPARSSLRLCAATGGLGGAGWGCRRGGAGGGASAAAAAAAGARAGPGGAGWVTQRLEVCRGEWGRGGRVRAHSCHRLLRVDRAPMGRGQLAPPLHTARIHGGSVTTRQLCSRSW